MSPSTDDSDLISLVRLAAKDPAKRVLLRQALESAGGNTLGGTLSNVGNAMSQSRGPGGALGTALGAGIGLLLRKRRQTPSATDPMQQEAAPANQPQPAAASIEPNLNSVAGTQPAPPPTPPPAPPPLPAAQGPAPAPGSARYKSALDRYGKPIHSNDGGATWTDESGNPSAGTPYSVSDIGGAMRKGGKMRTFAKGALVEELPPPAPKKAVLVRKPVAVPVISTTIVIAKKKKPDEKKKRGGTIQSKPATVAPATETPAPYAKGGRVQVPRGSGCATRGKRFRGIY